MAAHRATVHSTCCPPSTCATAGRYGCARATTPAKRVTTMRRWRWPHAMRMRAHAGCTWSTWTPRVPADTRLPRCWRGSLATPGCRCRRAGACVAREMSPRCSTPVRRAWSSARLRCASPNASPAGCTGSGRSGSRSPSTYGRTGQGAGNCRPPAGPRPATRRLRRCCAATPMLACATCCAPTSHVTGCWRAQPGAVRPATAGRAAGPAAGIRRHPRRRRYRRGAGGRLRRGGAGTGTA